MKEGKSEAISAGDEMHSTDLDTAVTAWPSDPAAWPAIGPDDVRTGLEAERLRLVDVREPGAYEAGHIPSAANVPFELLEQRIGAIPRDRAIVLVSDDGTLSSRARARLAELGLPGALTVEGGTRAWAARGYPVQTAA